MVKEKPGGHDMYGKKSGQAGRSINLVQEKLAIRETENRTNIDELLQARASGKMLKRIQILEDDSVPAKEAKKLED